MNLHFLHGFLGLPKDWECFKNLWGIHKSYTYSIEEFIQSANNKENSSFFQWTQAFHEFVAQQQANLTRKNILIGYSLGGRLALHCLTLESQMKWDGAIIIAANPGLQDAASKTVRLKNDEHWSRRFLKEDWQHILQDWDAQGVFARQKNTLIRRERDFQRNTLANMLVNFSLSKQEDLRKSLKNIKIPVLWLAGALDIRSAEIAGEMSLINKNINTIIFADVGHRVPWENQVGFVKECHSFLEDVG